MRNREEEISFSVWKVRGCLAAHWLFGSSRRVTRYIMASRIMFVALALLFVSFATGTMVGLGWDGRLMNVLAQDGFLVLRGTADHQINSLADTHVIDLVISSCNGVFRWAS
jgi:hypothetical protein